MNFRKQTPLLVPLALTIGLAGIAGTGGSVAGTVADPSGGVMPGVLVVVRNTETGVAQKTATNAEGFYGFPALPEGRYELQIDQPGFMPYRHTGLVVNANAALRVDVQLILETQSEAVTVSESPARLETANTELGEFITARQAASLPVNGRSYTDLLALQPGVIPASSRQPNA
ncbi:MAG TPA: carboxypeptidase-like regulatory domain-containing protein, partial [Bryobacteraceae bacterium]|nr:carboxypeptidase-like regulatory domain-containing protein [Bryobacteraceae bacterium]